MRRAITSTRCCRRSASGVSSTRYTALKTRAIWASPPCTAFTCCCATTTSTRIAAPSSTTRWTTCARRTASACRPCGSAAAGSASTVSRHSASKARVYVLRIEFFASSVFTPANRIAEDESDGRRQADKLVEMLLAFAEKSPGMVRVMTGDALVGEHERLQARMNQFFDRFEATLKQSLRATEDGDTASRAAAPLRYSIGW